MPQRESESPSSTDNNLVLPTVFFKPLKVEIPRKIFYDNLNFPLDHWKIKYVAH